MIWRQSLCLYNFLVSAYKLGRVDLHIVETGEYTSVIEVKAIGFWAIVAGKHRSVGIDSVVLGFEVRWRSQGQVGHQHSAQNIFSFVETDLNEKFSDQLSVVFQFQLEKLAVYIQILPFFMSLKRKIANLGPCHFFIPFISKDEGDVVIEHNIIVVIEVLLPCGIILWD